jgi:hypothetical protein
MFRPFKKLKRFVGLRIDNMTDIATMTLSDFVLYTGRLLAIVDLVLGEPSQPSKELPAVASFVAPTPSMTHPSKRTYYHSGFRKTLECIHHYLEQRLADNYYSCEEERVAEEVQIIRLFQPVVESIEHGIQEFDVQSVFQRLYEELQEYNTCYTKQYQKGMNRMVYLLMAIKEKDAKQYYQVIAHYDFAEYYRTLHELEDFPLLPAFAALLESPNTGSAATTVTTVTKVSATTMYQSYMECLERLRSRPLYLIQQQQNIAELQKLV